MKSICSCDILGIPGIIPKILEREPNFFICLVLLNAYASVPNANQISVMTDVATDNAVWNTSSGNAFRNIVSGEWSSTNNPFDKWSSAYTAIGYCNLFLDELVDRVEWSYSDAWLCEAFRERLTAEARGLRAYYYMELLTAHSGVGVNTGRLLGVPMIMHPIDVEDKNIELWQKLLISAN